MKLLIILASVLVLSVVGIQEVRAIDKYDMCGGLDFALQANPDEIAIVSITITSSEIIHHDPPLLTVPSPTYSTQTVGYDMDQVIYGNEEFPLQTNLYMEYRTSPLEIDDRFLIMYFFNDSWIETRKGSCADDGSGSVILFPLSVINYINIYVDLRDNQCNEGKKYLIKSSNDNKICVTPETREKLSLREYGYFMEPLSYRNWLFEKSTEIRESTPEPTPEKSITELQIPASFVDPSKDPQIYVDRYNGEPTYKEWFDENYSKYESIYQAVGLLQINSEIDE